MSAPSPPIDAFYLLLLAIFNGDDGPAQEQLTWSTAPEEAPVTFFVRCDDLFAWGCADAEKISPATLGALEQAARDLQARNPEGQYREAGYLWCCRTRGLRPQGVFYQFLPAWSHPLFDACGPPH